MVLFSKLFEKKETSVIGVDIGSSAIKIVQLKKKSGQAVLETYGELSLGPYANLGVGQAAVFPVEKVAEALTDLMKEKEVNITSKNAGLSIPFVSSLMAEIEMPEVSDKQLAVMVPLEARKYIPVPISEVILDWSIIPKSEVLSNNIAEDQLPEDRARIVAPSGEKGLSKMDVLIVAIHKDTIARYQDIVTKSGLNVGFYEIEIFSTMRAVLDESLRPVMIMDIGAASTKLYIVERGVIRSSHTVNRGSQDITTNIARALSITQEEAEVMKRKVGVAGENKNLNDVIALSLDYIFAEANNVLLSFEKKHNKTVAKAVLVGGGSALKGLAELAKNNFKTEVEQANPFKKVSTPAFLENILKETGPEFAVAIGLALRRLAEEG